MAGNTGEAQKWKGACELMGLVHKVAREAGRERMLESMEPDGKDLFNSMKNAQLCPKISEKPLKTGKWGIM